MKQIVFLIAVLSLTATGFASIWEGDILGLQLQGGLHGSVGIAYESKYIWRGFDVYNGKSAVHLLGDINLFETGFGISVAGHRANARGFENFERWDYTLYYQNGLFAGEPYATNYRVGWVYYNYPDNSSRWWDLQEGQAVLSWPNILPVKGLCPSVVLVKVWPSRSGSIPGGNASGWAYILMLDYGFTIPGILPEVPEQLIKLHSEAVFNDGIGPGGQNVDHDWSDAVFGVSTDFNLGYNIILTPAVYYQKTMDHSVNPDDNETWASFTLKYTF